MKVKPGDLMLYHNPKAHLIDDFGIVFSVHEGRAKFFWASSGAMRGFYSTETLATWERTGILTKLCSPPVQSPHEGVE